MKLYCVAIETKNIEDADTSDIRIDHFFADDKEQMENRVYEIVKAIKEEGIETIKHLIIPVNKVDGLDINKVFNIVYFNNEKENLSVDDC